MRSAQVGTKLKIVVRLLATVALATWLSPASIAQSIAPVAVTIPGGRLYVSQSEDRTVLAGKLHGQSVRVTLPSNDGIRPGSLKSARLIGGIADHAIILSIDYFSRPGNPDAMCGSGIETVIHVIAWKPRMHQSFHKLVESCWSNIEPADTAKGSAPIVWDTRRHLLTMDLMTSDGEVRSQYAIAFDGTVSVVSSAPAQP